jgi:hypothetical protein
MKPLTIKIEKEDIEKMKKSARREDLISSGAYSKPNHQVFKSKTDYTRKPKHKKCWLND